MILATITVPARGGSPVTIDLDSERGWVSDDPHFQGYARDRFPLDDRRGPAFGQYPFALVRHAEAVLRRMVPETSSEVFVAEDPGQDGAVH